MFMKFCRSTLTMNIQLMAYLQTNKLACWSFTDAGRRHEVPGSETKDRVLLTAVAVTRVVTIWDSSSKPQNPQGNAKKVRYLLPHWVVLQQRKSEFREPEYSIMENSRPAFALERDSTFIISVLWACLPMAPEGNVIPVCQGILLVPYCCCNKLSGFANTNLLACSSGNQKFTLDLTGLKSRVLTGLLHPS